MPLGNLSLIEEAFVEAAIDPSQWVKALDVVTTVTDSYGAVLLPVAGGMISALPFTEPMSRSFETYTKDSWFTRDERFRGITLMKQRGIVDDLDIFTPDQIKRHPYYQDFLAPHGLRWFGGIAISCGAHLWCLSIQRSIAQGPFSEEEKDQLAYLSKRLSGTAAVASTIGESAALGALNAFEISGQGAALINREGKIFRLNSVAEQLLKQDVTVVKGRLVAQDSAATASFEQAVSKLLNSDKAAMQPPVSFARPGRRPLLAYPLKLAKLVQNALADCQMVVVFVDTEQGPQPPTIALQRAFRLTASEARLAAELAAGEALEKVAEKLGITKETSRTQLKSIFAKTGCHRQAELVAVLSKFLRG
ncbi:helix-turn-helix transcriptional regulator [Bradyrhizobium mercantei]|uniref:helix-turn-helix transcriptional regulator n=1 Tax=Bradyrhizobium mercantei TaxID=1904807 RepID=UPI0009753CC4|nr:helix-turn-helix transcriptional regulator [Bradyrhizobium mercantei]